ncbi:MAG: CotH kinase family protein [Bacteroidales bacterium]|nr:CotH kinase family protein [Bacteroidales bacterium]MCF8391771.1 CotH kinase family protein [Bacteroidales bacterium]
MKNLSAIGAMFILACLFNSESLNAQDIVINEFMAANTATIQDAEGEYCDWLELFNNSEHSVNLLNYSLTDDAAELKKWILPEVTIASNAFLLIYASGKDCSFGQEIHTNFKISDEGEQLFLCDNTGKIIDRTESVECKNDEVYERFPDGSSNWIKSSNPSPGSSNIANNFLSLSPGNGFFTSPFYLHIFSQNGDTIYYTLDGSIPDLHSHIYTDSILMVDKTSCPNYFSEIPTSPKQSVISYKAWESPGILIDKASIIRCASYRMGKRSSKIYTSTYFINHSIFRKYDMPVISLVTAEENLFAYEDGIYVPGIHYKNEDPEWTGNYYQEGDDWERPVHIEYFETDGTLGFSQDAGIRIHGLKTRQAAQKSLRLYARNEYGEKCFNYPLLPQKPNTQYKRFLLQTSMGSWRGNFIFGDVLAQEIVRGLNFESADFFPVVVFINGEYWGIHTLRDRIDERFIEYTMGVDKDSVDLINGNYRLIEAGSNEHYIELAKYIEANDLTLESNYEYVKTQIDISSFIDYQIAEMFFSNKDWPRNNQKLWRTKNEDSRWRWIFFDIDAGFGNVNTNMFEQSLLDGVDAGWQDLPVSTFLFRNLLKNQSFTNQFIARYAEILNNEFNTNTMLTNVHFVKQMYEDEVPRHISRWNYPNSFSAWETDLTEELVSFLEERPCAAEKNIISFFNLSEFDFSCYKDIDLSDSIILAPNPNKGSFYIQNNSSESYIGPITITDIKGKIVVLNPYVFLSEGEKEYLNIEGLSGGIYFMKLKSNSFTASKAIVIIN